MATLERWLPGLGMLRGYERAWLRRDVLAGLSVAAIQVPTALAYAVVVVLKRLAPAIPGPLAGVMLGGILVLALDLGAHGVRVVGDVPQGLPALRVPSIEPADLRPLAVDALGIVVVSFCSAMLTSRSFAARNRYEIDPNQDLIALGVANMSAGLSQGFVISGADSRTAVNDAVGGKTQLTGVVAAAATAAVVVFFTAPLHYVPIPALAAVLIVAGTGLLDGATLGRLREVSPFEFRLSLLATLGVLTVGVLAGILVAVALAIVKLLVLASRPGEAILGEVPGQAGYHDVAGQPGARTVPGLVIYRFDAAPLFFNADYFKERVRAIVAAAPERPKWLLYSAEAANVLDFTGAEALEQIRGELAAQGIVLAIARPRGLFEVMLRRSGLAERLDAAHLFPTVGSAVQAYLERQPPATAPASSPS